MSDTYDVIVVGAGPAGSATARDIAHSGASVLLVEEHRAFGEPNHCSGLITQRTLDLAGTGEDIVLNRIRGARITAASGRSVVLGGRSVYALTIDRVELDRRLAAQAGAAGASVRTGTKLVEIERMGNRVRVTLEHAGKREQACTSLLIGADGAQSRVASWLGARRSIGERVIGLGLLLSMPVTQTELVEVFASPKLAPGFFAWSIPVGPGLARVGIATRGDSAPLHYMQKLLRSFASRFENAEVVGRSGGVVPLILVDKPYADNALLVGDAAGQVKPTSGGGIYSSLVGARHAAAAAIASIEAGCFSEARLGAYSTAWHKELGREFSRMRLLRRLFLSLSDTDIDRLLFLLGAPFLQRLIARHGDIDFPSAVVLKLVETLARLPFDLTLGLVGGQQQADDIRELAQRVRAAS